MMTPSPFFLIFEEKAIRGTSSGPTLKGSYSFGALYTLTLLKKKKKVSIYFLLEIS